MVGTIAEPVKPVTRVAPSSAGGLPMSCAVRVVIAERLAPVSSTSRYGPLPSISTGAQMRPIRSRRVGATNFGSVVCTMISWSSSCALGAGTGGRGGAPVGSSVSAPRVPEKIPSSTPHTSTSR